MFSMFRQGISGRSRFTTFVIDREAGPEPHLNKNTLSLLIDQLVLGLAH